MLQTEIVPYAKHDRSRKIHRGSQRLSPVPLRWSSWRTAPNIAAQTLFPWPAETYPGLQRGMVAVLHNRVKADTIKKWRQGLRAIPLWAIELIRAELGRRRQAIDHADALLAAELEKRLKR